jgi:hypothetical protein
MNISSEYLKRNCSAMKRRAQKYALRGATYIQTFSSLNIFSIAKWRIIR